MMRIIKLNTRNGREMMKDSQRYRFIWKVIQESLRSRRQVMLDLAEELSFFVYRSDNNAILAKGIRGYEAAKQRADQIRKQQGLPWNVVKFKAERRAQNSAGQYGVSSGGQNFTNASGQRGRFDYAPRYNPSKGRRFRGYTDPQGNYHDVD